MKKEKIAGLIVLTICIIINSTAVCLVLMAKKNEHKASLITPSDILDMGVVEVQGTNILGEIQFIKKENNFFDIIKERIQVLFNSVSFPYFLSMNIHASRNDYFLIDYYRNDHSIFAYYDSYLNELTEKELLLQH
ncbi:MAG: hypothetical protein JXJ04_26815 [Spirochaetales bacterium]|nr:hypothetical protein [Spirochaetales bacterium]